MKQFGKVRLLEASSRFEVKDNIDRLLRSRTLRLTSPTVRWQHQRRPPVVPDQVLPSAETLKRAVPISRRLRHADPELPIK